MINSISAVSANVKDAKNAVSFAGKDVLPHSKTLNAPKTDTFSKGKLDGPFCGIDYCAL